MVSNGSAANRAFISGSALSVVPGLTSRLTFYVRVSDSNSLFVLWSAGGLVGSLVLNTVTNGQNWDFDALSAGTVVSITHDSLADVTRVVLDLTWSVTDTTVRLDVGPRDSNSGDFMTIWGYDAQYVGSSTTDWVPGSDKVVFSECGAPAIDKATNQPNVFVDPKSSESFFPYHSSGSRDDLIQRLYYEALISYWRDNSPTSPITMLDPTDMYAWTWDARPYPAFPFRSDIWSDGPNYRLGHWLNGRIGVLTLGQLVKEICAIGGCLKQT